MPVELIPAKIWIEYSVNSSWSVPLVDRSALGKKSKNKGKTFERTVSHLFKDRGFTARRGQQFKGSPDSPDVVVEEIPEINLECKAVEKLNLYEAMDQAAKDCSPSQFPVVIQKRNNKGIIVSMRVEQFMDFIEVIYGARRGEQFIDNRLNEEVDGREATSDGRGPSRPGDEL